MGALADINDKYMSLKVSLLLLTKVFVSALESIKILILCFIIVLKKTDEGNEVLLKIKKQYGRFKLCFYYVYVRFERLSDSIWFFVGNIPSYILGFVKNKFCLFVWLLKGYIDKIPLGDFGKDKEIKALVLIIFSVLLIGLMCGLIITGFTVYSERLYLKDICLTDKCVTSFFSNFNSVSLIFQAVAWLITLITTVGGISIALMTYKAGVKNSNLTNHISHLNMFRDYVNAEITKRKFISPDKVNIYKWYSLIFPLSKKGDVTISSCYRIKIEAVVGVILAANKEIEEPGGKYIYTNHQVSLLEKIGDLGIKISTGPKNDFILIEEQIFELIDCINLTFTDMDVFLVNIKRSYI